MDVNPAGCAMFGYSVEEFLNANTSLLIFEEDRTPARAARRDENNAPGSDPVELRMRKKDGSEIWVEMTTEPFIVDGESRVLGIKRDITERKQAEKVLEKSKTQFQDIIEYSQSNITVKDLEGRFILVNPAFQKNYNISSQDVLGKTAYDFFPKEKADEFWQQELNVIKTGKPVSSETQLIWEGKIRNVINTKFPLIDNEGKPYAVCILSLEITDRMEAEEALKESKNQFQDIIEYSQSHITVKDLEGRYILVNPAFEKDFNINAQDMLGKTVHDLLPKEKADEYWQEELAVLSTGIPITTETSFNWQGKSFHGVNTKFPLVDSKGKPYAICILGLDITERVEAEQKLKEYSDNLEVLVEARTQELQDTQDDLLRKENLALLGALAGSMSHELRNPLAGISNAAYYLKAILPDADAKVVEHLEIISNSVQKADEIIQKLKDLLSSNPINKQKIKVSDLVSSAQKISLTPGDIKVSTNFPANLPEVVVDSTQIQHVIDNLLSNAYQAMPKGGNIKIGAKKKDNQVLISIQDNGIGISKEHKKKIFEPLFTTKETGMGLGLAVSKVITEANGGSISLESKLGKGSTFFLSLPCRPPAK